MSDAPFFIVGSGRSGTTLLRVILASHSRLTIPPETWFLNRMPDLLELRRPLTSEEIERAIQIMTSHYRWPDMNIDAGEFRRRVSELHDAHLSDVVEIVYRIHLERDRKVRWGDKTPGYIEILPQLADMFPKSKFIHFVRDGRDVARSFQAQRWYGPWLHSNTREWNEAMDFNERWCRSGLSGRILQARYEDLILDSEATVRKICDFLGEQFEPQMLAWQERAGELVPAREAHIHQSLKEKPDSTFVSRWKREMSAREIFVAEAFMGRHLRALGYELRYENAMWLPIFAMVRWYCRVLWPQLSLPVRAFRRVRAAFRGAPASAHGASARDRR